MEMEIATPEQQANLDSMSIEQLEAQVSQEEGAASVDGQTTAPNTGESVGQAQTQEEPKADAEPAWFTKYKEDQKRELGSLRSLASMKDQMPQMVQKLMQAEMAKLQQAQRNANLSPEDAEAQAQLQTQQEQWGKFVREQARAEFGEVGKDYIELLNEIKEQRTDSKHEEAVSSLVSEVIPDMSREKYASLYEGLAEKIEAGDQSALARFERLSTDPSFAALELIKAQRSQVQTQAANVTAQRSNAAKAAAQTAKPSTSASRSSKNLADMSQTELDKMSIADLEAALPEA